MRLPLALLALFLAFFGPSRLKADIYHYDGRGDVVGQTNSGGNLTYQAAYSADGMHDPAKMAYMGGAGGRMPGVWGVERSAGSTYDTGHALQANTKQEEAQYYEDTGVINDGFRYRDMMTGRFLTKDPLGFA